MNRMTEKELLQYVEEYGKGYDLYACNELGVPENAKRYLTIDSDCTCTYNIGHDSWETAAYTALYIDEEGILQTVLFYNLGKVYDDDESEFAIYPFSSLLDEECQTIMDSIVKRRFSIKAVDDG